MKRYRWENYPTSQLLEVRLGDLGLTLKGSSIERWVRRIGREMADRGLPLRPYAWLSSEWFVPDGFTGIAIPFYLVHPRLRRLERQFIGEVEGERPTDGLRILRHEAGHVLANAYGLRRKRKVQETFGRSSLAYPRSYFPRPYSRRFVRHLPGGYAQSHPDEDFAETFAVWLTPGSNWRKRYANWPALRKLEVMDEIVDECRSLRPQRTVETLDPIGDQRLTLRKFYLLRRARLGLDRPVGFEADLRRLFSSAEGDVTAASVLRRVQPNCTREAAQRLGLHQYLVREVASEMTQRCQRLKLRAQDTEKTIEKAFTALLAKHSLKFVKNRRHHVVL